MLPSRLPGSGAHWIDHVARHAHATPDSVAIRFEGESITWARLHERVRRLAAAFAGWGVRPGDRIAILMTNRPEFVEATLAANVIGAIAVPVSFRLAPAEAAYVLGDSGAAVIVADAQLAPLAAAASAALPQPPRVIVTGLDPAGAGGQAESYQALLDGVTAAPPDVQIDERDVALIMYTSGTTGRPKGAMLTH
jgi:fatty-acyl-CoA synthase